MSMRFLSNKEKKTINVPEGYEITKKDDITIEGDILYKNDEKYLICRDDGKYWPHLKSVKDEMYPRVVIDDGAVPFIVKGADLMRPGIVEIEGEFQKNDVVLVYNVNFKRPLAIGVAMFDNDEMRNKSGGKVIKIYHHVKDELY